jgi:lipopolysaccharide transport system permease protein
MVESQMASSILHTIWRHRSLVIELVKREFTGRYRGSFGGMLWSFVQPLFLLGVYTIAFGVVLKTRWGITGNTEEYAFMLFAGLIIFNTFAECLKRAPTLITANPNFVKKIVFPLELLPLVMALAAIVHALISVAVWICGYVVIFGLPKLTLLYFPLVLAAFFPVILGLGWLLAALGVIVRDIDQLTGIVAHALLFLTPIFFSIDSSPKLLQQVLAANPLTFIVDQFRQVMFIGNPPNLVGLVAYSMFATAFSAASLFLFRCLRTTFADLV